MAAFPFLSLAQAVVVLRVGVSIVFLAHATVRILNGTVPQFGGFLEQHAAIRFPAGSGRPFVVALTAVEIVGGLLLALGIGLPWVPLWFAVQLLGGIILIHHQHGWFTGEHGSGGIEYPSVLILALLVIAASHCLFY